MNTKTFLCEYKYEGDTWGFEITATSAEDAKARMRRIASNGQVVGELGGAIKVRESRLMGWLSNALINILNLFSRN